MAANRNKSRNSSINKLVDKFQRLNLPPQIIHLLRRTKKRTPLHHVSITCITKWWVPPAIRCNRTRFPEFRHLGISSNTTSASTRHQHFYGDFVIHNAATDFRQVMAYSRTENTWVGYDFDPLDPFVTKKKCIELLIIMGKQGNFAGIEHIDSRVTLTGIHINKGAPSANWRLFREHLLEMEGELFLIFLIHKKSIDIVDHVEVFRLCFDELKWVKIEGMTGKTVFLGRDCCWVDSGEIGCRGDCVYFTQGQDNCWWVYDMQSCCISAASVENGWDIQLRDPHLKIIAEDIISLCN